MKVLPYILTRVHVLMSMHCARLQREKKVLAQDDTCYGGLIILAWPYVMVIRLM